MNKIRVIARLDIKGANLIKGVHLEGLKIIGDPHTFAHKYYDEGADELIYIDSVASLYERNNILDIVSKTVEDVFIPLTVGGGIRSVEDAKKALRAGADKIAINTAAIKNPNIITEIAEHFGNQCVVVSIEAKRKAPNQWEAYTDNGREKTNIDVVEWVRKVQSIGAGEILLTSIDQEGTQKGFDIELIRSVMDVATIPVIASGGMGEISHIHELLQKTNVDAIAVAHGLHYNSTPIQKIKHELQKFDYE
ncbi:MAG: imidazole glycerol phosphate synthase subunit HisF [Proteobacteria bacterium]|nr:imidazole glycerol phosphate synthase subunit HisF [Pseudomonadota bacterium]